MDEDVLLTTVRRPAKAALAALVEETDQKAHRGAQNVGDAAIIALLPSATNASEWFVSIFLSVKAVCYRFCYLLDGYYRPQTIICSRCNRIFVITTIQIPSFVSDRRQIDRRKIPETLLQNRVLLLP
jgi:hypothetical protein